MKPPGVPRSRDRLMAVDVKISYSPRSQGSEKIPLDTFRIFPKHHPEGKRATSSPYKNEAAMVHNHSFISKRQNKKETKQNKTKEDTDRTKHCLLVVSQLRVFAGAHGYRTTIERRAADS